jgi:hypothetical protein
VTYRTSRLLAFGTNFQRSMEAAMFDQQHFPHVNTIFGSGYLTEHHAGEKRHFLPPPEPHEFVINFEELLRRLRAALSLR